MPTLRNRYMSALSASEVRGREAEDEYFRRAREFDPTQAVTTAAEGAWGQILPQVRDAITELRGRMVGAGRLRGGYGEMDEDEVWNRATQQLTSEIARNAMSAAGLQLQNIQGIGGYGERATNRYLDLLSGGMDRELMEREMARQRRASRWGALAGLAGAKWPVSGGRAGGELSPGWPVVRSGPSLGRQVRPSAAGSARGSPIESEAEPCRTVRE